MDLQHLCFVGMIMLIGHRREERDHADSTSRSRRSAAAVAREQAIYQAADRFRPIHDDDDGGAARRVPIRCRIRRGG
jgi:hypothetical protein